MNIKALIITLLLIFTVVGIGVLYQTVPVDADKRVVNMQSPSGEDMGTIELSETKAGVLLSMSLEGLTPNGEHAIHVHAVGKCDGAKGFKSAGGHYNPFESAHGMKHPEGHHAGDMPNLKPDEEGMLTNQILNFKITLSDKSTDKRAIACGIIQ